MSFLLMFLPKILGLIPYVVAGVEQMHKDAPGHTKKELAMEALGIAGAGADAVLTGDQKDLADMSKTLVSNNIDQVVAIYQKANTHGFTAAKPAAQPAK